MPIQSRKEMTSEELEFCFISLGFKSTYATQGSCWKHNEIWQVGQTLQSLPDI